MIRPNRISLILLGLSALLLGGVVVPLQGLRDAAAGERPGIESIAADAIRAHISLLASDSLGGRHPGSPGFDRAAQYAEQQFIAAGLATVAEATTQASGGPQWGTNGLRAEARDVPARTQGESVNGFFQPVPMVRRTAEGEVSLKITARGQTQSFAHREDFKVLMGDMRPFEDKQLPVVFAGYGISEPGLGWDDLHGLDLSGKAVVFLPGAPLNNGKPVLPGAVHEQYAQISSLMKKVVPLFFKRPAVLLLVADEQIETLWDAVPALTDARHLAYGSKNPEALHFCCICVIKPNVVEALFSEQGMVPPQKTAGGFALKNVSLILGGKFVEQSVPGSNVLGIVRGSDPSLARQYVAVTAHLDTNSPRDGEVMNGADDDASGCAALFEIARAVASSPPRRSVIFVAFSGEEGGSIGSRHFVSFCPIPVSSIVANINMDGIGRSDPAENERTAFALDSGKITPAFTRLIEEVNASTVNWPLKYEYRMGYSDHLMFHAVGVPAVNFYSGHHEDVNSPTDDVEKIDFEKAEQISRLVYELTMELADRDKLWR